jgi:hypothetical protein
MELQVLPHFSKELTTCPYTGPAEATPRKQTLFFSDSFYKTRVCTSSHFLSGIPFKTPWPINFHSKSCHIHCQSHSSSCCSVSSFVSLSLETVWSIPLVFAVGKLLAILLFVIEICVSRQRYIQIQATSTNPIATLLIKKFHITKEFQSSPIFKFTVWSYFLRKIQQITA